jgi:membrane protease YdiL (CAAX protease family)
MNSAGYALSCAAAVSIWIALYRLPFNDPGRRRRVALWLADRTGFHPDGAFAVFATALYLGLGIVVLLVMFPFSNLAVGDLLARPDGTTCAALLLAIAGTSSLNILCISMLYRARPRSDVPGEIARIQWISSILTLPRRFRWIIPAAAALVEELVFRGLIFGGMLSLGSSFLVASVISTGVFVIGQIVLVSTPVQAFVMGTSSAVLGTIGTLLIAGTGSIIPALILHMSFAGFYTNMSAGNRRASTIGKVSL